MKRLRHLEMVLRLGANHTTRCSLERQQSAARSYEQQVAKPIAHSIVARSLHLGEADCFALQTELGRDAGTKRVGERVAEPEHR